VIAGVFRVREQVSSSRVLRQAWRVRALHCPTCAAPVFFENDVCLSCGTAMGFEPGAFAMAAVDATAGVGAWTPCANQVTARCNWVVPAARAGSLCRSCELTRTRPADDDGEGLARFREAEQAKRRLVAQLLDLGLPVTSYRTRDDGLAFDLLSSRFDHVVTGHQGGLVTLDLAEVDDAHRERVRQELGEAYRTVLGHLRHEVGHHYWNVLVRDRPDALERFRRRFGDERADYDAAVSAHYAGPGSVGWETSHVSAYATMHPWEDWAETFAHYLHLRDALQTAAALGVVVRDPARGTVVAVEEPGSFAGLAADWISLAGVLNALSRSMGAPDLYPFVLAPAVIDKLGEVHRLVVAARVS
jgi:hypothetical protein